MFRLRTVKLCATPGGGGGGGGLNFHLMGRCPQNPFILDRFRSFCSKSMFQNFFHFERFQKYSVPNTFSEWPLVYRKNNISVLYSVCFSYNYGFRRKITENACARRFFLRSSKTQENHHKNCTWFGNLLQISQPGSRIFTDKWCPEKRHISCSPIWKWSPLPGGSYLTITFRKQYIGY